MKKIVSVLLSLSLILAILPFSSIAQGYVFITSSASTETSSALTPVETNLLNEENVMSVTAVLPNGSGGTKTNTADYAPSYPLSKVFDNSISGSNKSDILINDNYDGHKMGYWLGTNTGSTPVYIAGEDKNADKKYYVEFKFNLGAVYTPTTAIYGVTNANYSAYRYELFGSLVEDDLFNQESLLTEVDTISKLSRDKVATTTFSNYSPILYYGIRIYYLGVYKIEDDTFRLGELQLAGEEADVVSISYKTDYNVFTENVDGEWDNEANYFRYNCGFHEGDELTLYYSEGEPKVFTAEFTDGEIYFRADGEAPIQQGVDIYTSSNQDEEHWVAGGSYSYKVDYRGKQTDVPVSVIANPVDSISYTPREGCITRYFEMGGDFEDDGNGDNYYRYNVVEYSTGDILTVNYSDERGTVNYVLTNVPEWIYVSETDENDFIYSYNVNMFDEQRNTHYTLGDSNSFYVEYMGKRTEVRVNIINNPISSLVYVPARNIEIYENSNGWWDTDESGNPVYRYNSPRFSAGDRLEITYSDTGDTAVYTYLDYFDEDDREWHTGFYNENREELPDRDKLYVSDTNGWGLGDENYLYVYYKDNKSNGVRVNIVTNPVKTIRFERANPVVIIENSDMYYDEWDNRNYYNIPYHRLGDRLIIIDNEDNEIVYTYQNEGAYVSEGKDDIPSSEVRFNSNQRENPWTLGENEYTVEYLGKTYTLTATIKENTVKAIRYECAYNQEFYENTNGYYNDENGYFHYWYSWQNDGDKLIVIDNDNKEIEYEFKLTGLNGYDRAFVSGDGDIIESSKVQFDDEQRQNPWVVGDANEYYVEYSGARFTLYATIKENNVKEIRFEPVKTPTVMVGVRSYYDPEIEAEIFEEPEFNEGDRLIVVDKNDIEKVYTARYNEYHDIIFRADDGEEIDGYDLWRGSEQWDEPWSLGDDNEYFIEYLNNICYVKCTVIDNPVDSIEFIPSEKTVYLEGTNMFYDDWREHDVYEMPRVNDGDILVVYYKDASRGRVEYVAKFDNENDVMTYVSDDGEIIVEDRMFEFRDEQDFEPWSVGENYYTIMYCGKSTQVPVTIKENNIASISYTSAQQPQVWITDFEMDKDEETGREYKHYNIPDFSEGDILTITDTDGVSAYYTLVFDESDGERYFVNGEERYHQYTLFPFDNQSENEWHLGKGNYYYVDFYGFIAPIEVEVIETDVESISFNPVKAIELPEYVDGEYIYDDHGEKFYLYDRVQIVNVGDSLTVTYKNGDVVTYILGNDETGENWTLRSADGQQEIDPYEVNIDDHQWDNHWKVGNNSFDVTYHGARTSVPVIVNHTPGGIVIENKIEATLTEEGSYDEVVYCTACGEELSRENKLIPVISADAPQIEIETKKSCAGKTVDVKISFKNNPGITSAKIVVNFSEELTLKDVKFGIDTGMTETSETLNSPLTLNWFNNHKSYNASDFVFATLTFEVADDTEIGVYDITVDYDPDDVYNTDLANIDFAVINGAVEVVDHIPGDVNDDGKVNNKDITALFKYLSDWDVEVNEAALDINGDKKINNKDLTRLFQYLSDWDVEIF